MEDQKREFKGIWIPKEIYLNKSLNWNEKILLIEIDSLDNAQGCFSSNKHFAEFLGVTERAVTGMIAKLKELGYISQSSFDGRRRVLHSNVKICVAAQKWCSDQSGSKLPCTPEAGFEQSNPVNNISNNIESKDATPPKTEPKDKFCGHTFSEPMQSALTDWLTYKSERREGYKPTGLKRLLSEVENKLKAYEEADVIALMGESMANNWKGICWDKLQGKEKPPEPVERPIPPEILRFNQQHGKVMRELRAGKGDWKELLPE